MEGEDQSRVCALGGRPCQTQALVSSCWSRTGSWRTSSSHLGLRSSGERKKIDHDRSLSLHQKSSGPYRYTRNPLYLGNLLIGIGVVVSALSLWVLAVFLVLFLVFYPVVIHSEKQKMEHLFPTEYTTYREKVPLFLPNLKPSLPRQTTPFSRSLYKKNKECRALIGTAIFWIAMAGRLIF